MQNKCSKNSQSNSGTAVLVAIAIPVFTSQLEKSREATDLANIRSAYAEITVKAIENPSTSATSTNGLKKTISLKQKVEDWQTGDAKDNMEQVFGNSSRLINFSSVTSGKKAKLEWNAESGTGSSHTDGYVTLTIDD